MSRQLRQTLSPTLFVERGSAEIPAPGTDFIPIEHYTHPAVLACGKVAIVWNLVTIGLDGEAAAPFKFDRERGVEIEFPPESKVTLVRTIGLISATQWAIVVRNERSEPADTPFLIDYTFRLRGPDETALYGPPIDPALIVTPHPTIPPG